MCLNLFSDEPLSTRKLGQVGPVGAVYCSRELFPDQKVKQIENNKFLLEKAMPANRIMAADFRISTLNR